MNIKIQVLGVKIIVFVMMNFEQSLEELAHLTDAQQTYRRRFYTDFGKMRTL